jgi:hypothetical protein
VIELEETPTSGYRWQVQASDPTVLRPIGSDVIVLAVRWYLRFGLSYRDVEELLAERGIQVEHVTIHRWARRFSPSLADVAPVRPASGPGLLARG